MALPARREMTYRVPLPQGDRRMRELIVYIANKCHTDPTFGATKLNKILFYADFVAFHRDRSAITGEEYQRLENGPAPRRMLPIRQSMEQAGDIVVRPMDYRGFIQKRVIALREADLTIFSGADIALVDEVIEAFWGHTAKEISRYSHGPWWKACFDGESIPYEFTFLSAEPVTDGDSQRAQELAKKYKWPD